MKAKSAVFPCVILCAGLISPSCNSDGVTGDAGAAADAAAAGDTGVTVDAGAVADGGTDAGAGLPQTLPFTFTRSDVGEPLTPAEVTAFTKKITGFFKQTGFFTWVLRISHGVDASTGLPDWMIWWHDVDPIKTGDTVQWHHGPRGGAHNPIKPTMKLLLQAGAGYLASGDPTMGRIAEQYAKGLSAMMKGMVFNESDPLCCLMARNIIVRDHDFVIEGDKKKSVSFGDWYSEYEGWNAARYHYPDNPTWGDIWVTNDRSKDDVPQIYLGYAMLRYLAAQAPDASVAAAAKEAVELMGGFARDIVENGYQIRSKDRDGKPFVPAEDLASFTTYEFLDPNAECNAKLTTSLIATGELGGNNCRGGGINAYDAAAIASHYYNFEIVRTFHVASLLNALVAGKTATAEALMGGFNDRVAAYENAPDAPLSAEPGFPADMAILLSQAAAAGFPLTSIEARRIHEWYGKAVDVFAAWPYFNLWDPAVPDGLYEYQPADGAGHIPAEDMAYVLSYCWSPFKNPSGVAFVDCDVVNDPSRWGE